MAIQNRRGNKSVFDPNKLLPGEFAYVLDDTPYPTLYYCYSAGNVKRLLTTDDVIEILNASESAYAALQKLLSDLESNPSELTNILNNILALQSGKLDKAGAGYIADANGNEIIKFAAAVAGAVNEISVTNAATANGPIIEASGGDVNIDLNVKSKGTGLVKTYVNGVISFVVNAVAAAVNYLTIKSSITGTAPTITATGTDTNININIVPKGTGVVQAAGAEVVTVGGTQTLSNKTLGTPKFPTAGYLADANGNELIKFPVTVASAVNEVTIGNAATSGAPSIYSTGNDTNIGLNFYSKAAGLIKLYINNVVSAVFDAAVSAVNYLTFKSNITGAAPSINATGTDINIDINLVPKGTGRVKQNGTNMVLAGEDYQPNLLINGDFQVWQRGTSFTDTGAMMYSADRWKIFNAVVTKNSNGGLNINRYGASGYGEIIYFDEKSYEGQKLTLSIKIDGVVYSATGISSASFVSTSTPIGAFRFSTSGGKLLIELIVSSDSNVHVVSWVKLEINDHATPLIPKSYNEEISACYRYFQPLILAFQEGGIYVHQVSSNKASGTFQHMVQMRIAPILVKMSDGTVDGRIISYSSLGVLIASTQVTISQYSSNKLSTVLEATLPSGSWTGNENHIEFDTNVASARSHFLDAEL